MNNTSSVSSSASSSMLRLLLRDLLRRKGVTAGDRTNTSITSAHSCFFGEILVFHVGQVWHRKPTSFSLVNDSLASPEFEWSELLSLAASRADILLVVLHFRRHNSRPSLKENQGDEKCGIREREKKTRLTLLRQCADRAGLKLSFRTSALDLVDLVDLLFFVAFFFFAACLFSSATGVSTKMEVLVSHSLISSLTSTWCEAEVAAMLVGCGDEGAKGLNPIETLDFLFALATGVPNASLFGTAFGDCSSSAAGSSSSSPGT